MGLTRNLPLPKVSMAFKIVGSNQGPNHILIPEYQVEPLAHAGIYGEGEMSQVVIFVLVYHLFEFYFCNYYLSSGSRLRIINLCFVWRRLYSFHLP